MTNDEHCMMLAIEASRQALARGDRPFGATLARDGQPLLSVGNNQVSSGDCTGHAELVLVREATARLGASAVVGATVYASGEPCAMCSGALFWAGVQRVVFAAPTPEIGRLLGLPQLPARCAELLGAAIPPVTVQGPLLQDEALDVLARAAKGKSTNDS